MSELPNTWAEVTLGDVIAPFTSIDPRRDPNAEFTYIDIGSIDNSTQTIAEPKTFKGIDAPSRARRLVEANDVLFSTVRTYLKNIAMVPQELDGNLTSTGIAILRSNGAVEPRYLFHYVRSDEFIKKISAAQDGTLYPAVTDKDVQTAPVPIASLAEQRRIVEKVDSLTARTARARKELDRVPTLIEHYKSAILQLAFTGALTKDWRSKEGIAEAENDGLPAQWRVMKLGEISEIQGGIQVGKKRPPGTELVEVPYLRVANVQRGWLNLEEIKTIQVTAAERDRLLLETGDILMNEGGDRDKLGRGWIWGGEIPDCIHQNHVFRIRLNDGAFPPEFVSHFANENGQRYFFDQGTQTTNLASISKKKISALPIPIPSPGEAIEIVKRIQNAFSWLSRLSNEHDGASKLLPKLDATILAKAFRGELVPQDPNDEPASALLERVKKEVAAKPKVKRRKTANSPESPKESQTMTKSLEEVLAESGGWISAQEAFEQCGVHGAATTEEIEKIYAELRALDKAGKLEAEPINDDQGRKLHDRLRLKAA